MLLSAAAIIENRRGKSLLSRLMFVPDSEEMDAKLKRKPISKIILVQADYVLTIIAGQGSFFGYILKFDPHLTLCSIF